MKNSALKSIGLVVLVLAVASTPLPAQSWTQLATTGGLPAARVGASAVFDSTAHEMIVFGGQGYYGDYNDVRVLNTSGNGVWSLLTPSGSPLFGRVGHTAVYDSVNSRMIVFGGGLGSTSPCVNDTWVLTGANGMSGAPAWTQLSASGDLPAARVFHTAVYDPAANRMIVFGGTNCAATRPQFYNDVWVLASANGLGGAPSWTKLATSGTPPNARQGAVASYDASSNRMIVFGGVGTGSEFNDVWMLSNANGVGGTPTWIKLSPSGTAPSGRAFAAGVYDAASNRMFLFGGMSGDDTLYSGAWVLGGANGLNGAPTWTQLNVSGITAREGHTAVYDAANARMIVFGGDGSSGTHLNDTWALTLPAAPATTPAIGNTSPSSGTAGGPAFTLTVNGSNFVPGAAVQWNGTALATTFVSAAQLTATVPAPLIASPASASITVVNPGGTASNTAAFAINPPVPGIAILSPNSAVAGGPAFTLTVIGTGFLPGAGVQWNGAALSTTFVNATQLTAVVPAGLIALQGNSGIVVVNPGGTASGPATFVVTPRVLTIMTVQTLPAGVVGVPYSQNLSAVGGNPPYIWALLAGPPPPGIVMSSTGTLSGTPTTPGTTNFTVQVTDATFATSVQILSLTITAPVPTITSLNPSSIGAGGPAFTLTVNGTNFVTGTVVQWNATALSTTPVDSTQLNAAVPASLIAAQGSASIVAVNPSGAVSGPVTFTINAGGLTIITPTLLPPGQVGVPYSQALAATGGVTPYKSWSVSAGTLPPGISLSTLGGVLTGLLNGVPTTAGTYIFNVKVTDAANKTDTALFTLVISAGAPTISANGIVNAASYAAGAVAPGELVTIFGIALGPGALNGLELDSRGYVSASLHGVQVLFDGIAAPLIYVEDDQISAIVPYEIAGRGSTQVQVAYQGKNSNPVAISVGAVAPGIFTLDSSGRGPGAIINQNGTVNSSRNPASVSSYVFIYATGEGQTNPAGVDGKPAGSPAPRPIVPVTATVGGVVAQVQYAGGVPGLVAGVLQVNVQIPRGVTAGNSVPIVLNIGGASTQANVTLAVR